MLAHILDYNTNSRVFTRVWHVTNTDTGLIYRDDMFYMSNNDTVLR